MREIAGRDEMRFRSGPGPATRVIGLVAALSSEDPPSLRALSLPMWEERLLSVRSRVIGSRIEAEIVCPDCGLEALLAFDAGDLPRVAPELPEAPIPLRPLTAGDIADLEATGGAGPDALAFLLSRAGQIDEVEAAAALSGAAAEALTAALEVLASGLALDLGTRCLDCDAAVAAPFDVAAFFDAELQTRAVRLIDEVHLIASTYHWGEGEILDLPFARRQAYLSRILGDRTLSVRPSAVA